MGWGTSFGSDPLHALTLCLSYCYVTPGVTPFAQTHPYLRREACELNGPENPTPLLTEKPPERLNSLNSLSSYQEWPTLAQEAFHGLAGTIVNTIAPHSEADPVALLMQLLEYF